MKSIIVWILFLYSFSSLAALSQGRIIQGVVLSFDRSKVILRTETGDFAVPRDLISEKESLRTDEWLKVIVSAKENSRVKKVPRRKI